MGWLYENNNDGKKYNNKQLKELIEQQFRAGCVASVSIKNWKEAYVLHDDATISVVIFINNSKTFGTKIMHESCHPYYYNCPKRWLKLPCKSDLKRNDWREICKVRK